MLAAGYELSPPAEALAALPASSLSSLTGLTVLLRGVGSIHWPGPVDARDIGDLGELLEIGEGSVQLYAQDGGEGQGQGQGSSHVIRARPAPGSGLNCRAQLSLLGVDVPEEGAPGRAQFEEDIRAMLGERCKLLRCSAEHMSVLFQVEDFGEKQQ